MEEINKHKTFLRFIGFIRSQMTQELFHKHIDCRLIYLQYFPRLCTLTTKQHSFETIKTNLQQQSLTLHPSGKQNKEQQLQTPISKGQCAP